MCLRLVQKCAFDKCEMGVGQSQAGVDVAGVVSVGALTGFEKKWGEKPNLPGNVRLDCCGLGEDY